MQVLQKESVVIFSSRSPSKALREGIETEGPVDK